MRRVRQWFWSRYALISEVQTNEKALLETFGQVQIMENAYDELESLTTLLEITNKKLAEKCAAQELMLAALGEVETSKAGSGHD